MNIIYGFFIFIEAMISIMLIGIILIQKTKGGMGGTAFGGGMGEAIFGSRMGNVLTKSTVILGVAFLINTLLLTVMTSRRGGVGGSVTDIAPAVPVNVPAAAQPAAAQPVAAQPAQPVQPEAGAQAVPVQLPEVDISDAADQPVQDGLPDAAPATGDKADASE